MIGGLQLLEIVCIWIEQLAWKEKLKKMCVLIKYCFKNLFLAGISHADKLLNSVYHKIQIKPLAKIMVA